MLEKNMNILMIAKFPPIQGGESTKTYWLAKGLSQRGNRVHIVSNNMEVEPEYREELSMKDFDRISGDGIVVHSSNPLEDQHFVPHFRPYTDKLVSMALDVTHDERIDVILGWYLLPYAVAAGHVSRMTGIPYAVQHAGSDMKRLLADKYLKTLLKRTITDANGVFHYPGSKADFIALGVSESKLFEHTPTLPAEYFHTEGQVKLKNYFLFLGKMSLGKGCEDAFDAFKKIKREDYLLLYVGNGPLKETLMSRAEREGVGNVRFLNYVAPWQVPSLMQGATGIIVAENKDFNVPKHLSRIPLEGIISGTPLVISDYAQQKGIFRELKPEEVFSFRQKDSTDLAERIRFVIENTGIAREGAARAKKFITDRLPSFDEYILKMEQHLLALTHHA